MAYNKDSGTEQVAYNMLGQRTERLANLSNRAGNSFLAGKLDDYFHSLTALRQGLTPNLTNKESKVLLKIENNIHSIKQLSLKYAAEDTIDTPGFAIVSMFRKKRQPISHSRINSTYVEKIKKFERALLLIMRRKGFFPGKSDAGSIS